MKVLIVDDDRVSRMLLGHIIGREFGGAITEAIHGAEALEVLKRQSFDFILLDLMMPVMDGLQTLEAIRANDALRQVPVVILSAVKEEGKVRRILQLGVTDYLAKPLQPKAIVQRLHRIVPPIMAAKLARGDDDSAGCRAGPRRALEAARRDRGRGRGSDLQELRPEHAGPRIPDRRRRDRREGAAALSGIAADDAAPGRRPRRRRSGAGRAQGEGGAGAEGHADRRAGAAVTERLAGPQRRRAVRSAVREDADPDVRARGISRSIREDRAIARERWGGRAAAGPARSSPACGWSWCPRSNRCSA